MRKLTVTLIAALALAPAARAAETKIAVVDFQKAGLETDEGKAIAAQLSKEMEEKQAQLDAKQKEFKALRDDFEKQAALLNEQTKAQKTADLEKRGEEVQQMFMQLQQELGQREQEASRGMSDRLRGVVKEVAEGAGLAVVVDRQAVVWAATALDITSEVIRKYNTRFPWKGALPPAAKGGAAKPGAAKPK